MLVGEGWALDEGGEGARVACNLVAVPAYTAGVDVANGPMMFQPAPNPDDYFTAASLFQAAQLFPAQVKAADAIHTTLSASEVSTNKVVQAGASAGFTWLNCGVKVNFLGEPDYTPFAERFKSCGAQLVFTNQPPGPLTYNFLTAMNNLSYHPIILGEADVYGPAMAQWNTAGLGDNVYVRQAFQPLENAPVVPAVQQYLSIVHASGGKVGQLGEQAASAFLLWATAAKSCGSDAHPAVHGRRPVQDPQVGRWWAAGSCRPGSQHAAGLRDAREADGHDLGPVLPEDTGADGLQPELRVHITGPRRGRRSERTGCRPSSSTQASSSPRHRIRRLSSTSDSRPAPRRGAGAARPLTREMIIAATAELLRVEPQSPPTMARVAEAVSASPMALYRHFRDRDDLMLAVTRHVLTSQASRLPKNASWQEELRAWMLENYRQARAYPQLMQLSLGGDATVWLGDAAVLVRILEHAGIPAATCRSRCTGRRPRPSATASWPQACRRSCPRAGLYAALAELPDADAALLAPILPAMPGGDEGFDVVIEATIAAVAHWIAPPS